MVEENTGLPMGSQVQNLWVQTDTLTKQIHVTGHTYLFFNKLLHNFQKWVAPKQGLRQQATCDHSLLVSIANTERLAHKERAAFSVSVLSQISALCSSTVTFAFSFLSCHKFEVSYRLVGKGIVFNIIHHLYYTHAVYPLNHYLILSWLNED